MDSAAVNTKHPLCSTADTQEYHMTTVDNQNSLRRLAECAKKKNGNKEELFRQTLPQLISAQDKANDTKTTCIHLFSIVVVLNRVTGELEPMTTHFGQKVGST